MRRVNKFVAVTFILIGASLASAQGIPSNPANNLSSTNGVPSGGFLPYNLDGSSLSQGCFVGLAGGNMGSASYQGANFLMSCDVEDTSGRFMWITQNDSANFPRTMFEVRRNGNVYANCMSIQQTLAYNQPIYFTPWQFQYDAALGWAALNVTTDVPSLSVPVVGVWGLVSQYSANKAPLVRMYG